LKENTVELHKEYKEKMGAQLKWSAQVNLLEARIDSFTADMKIMRAEEIQALRAKQHAAADKMKELGKASGEAWDQVRVTADRMWDDLKTGLTDAQSKFK
jgi:outer membrane murein-binding lipoprotein Lpp